ncbi:hypothetical protein Tco_1365446, partial [Tanacetum coccineum]
AALRTSLLDVVCEIVGWIETNDITNIISQMEEIESQLSAVEVAKINVSWLQASLNAIHKRNKDGIKVTLLMEMKTNNILVKRATSYDLMAVCGSTRSYREEGKQKMSLEMEARSHETLILAASTADNWLSISSI